MRSMILNSDPWAQQSLDELAPKANEWGYQGLELACWGDHFEVQRALNEADYCAKRIDLLSRNDLTVSVLNARRVGHAVCGPVDARFQELLPDYVWGDGAIEEVMQRSSEEMLGTLRAAQKLGVATVCTWTGSTMHALSAVPWPIPEALLDEAIAAFGRAWQPVLALCQETGLRLAVEVQPGQMVHDLVSAERALDAVHGQDEFGFAFNPSALHWQGIDPAEFVRRFGDRIYHVCVNDCVLTLNGRASVLCSALRHGDPRRGWQYRSPGHGGLDWEGIIRALNDANYDGPLSVDWHDAGMGRDYGAEDACKFLQRLNFELPDVNG